MDKELLSWIGNFINFLILIYLSLTLINEGNFNLSQTLIAVFGLLVSVLINWYNIIK